MKEFRYIDNETGEVGSCPINVDLSDYYTKSETDRDFATKTELNAKADSSTLSGYAKTTTTDGLQSSIDEINGYLNKSTANATLTASPTTIEKGVATNVTLTWNYTARGATQVPKTAVLKQGSNTLYSFAKATDGNNPTKTKSVSISSTNGFSLVVTDEGGISINKSVTVNAYNRVYYGTSADGNTLPNLSALTNAGLKSTPKGYQVTINIPEGHYIWFYVKEYTITTIQDVGFNYPITYVNKGTKDGFTAFRSPSNYGASSVTLKIN